MGTPPPLDVRHGILSPRDWIRVVPSDCCINYSHENVTTTIYRNANAEYGENAIGSTEMEPFQERASKNSAHDPEAAQRHLSEVTAIWKKYDCHPVKSLAPLLVSAPVFISFYFAISRMADGIDHSKMEARLVY